MHLIINNYEVQEASTFFSMSDIISALTALIAIVTLVFTLISNKKSLNKTLKYETNKKNLIEINEVAVSVKEMEHEIDNLKKMLEKVKHKESGEFRVFESRELTERMNLLGDKMMYMEIQFELKSYMSEIKTLDEYIKKKDNVEKKECFLEKVDTLWVECLELETTSLNRSDMVKKEEGIEVISKDIIKRELENYLEIIKNIKNKLLINITNVNNNDFS